MAEPKLPNQKTGFDPNLLFGTKFEPKSNMKAPAMVPYADPNKIVYDPKQILAMPDNYVMSHEMEHILDNRAEQRYGKDGNKEQLMYNAYVQAGGKPDGDYQEAFRYGLATTPVQKRLEELGLSDGYTSGYPKVDKQGTFMNAAPWHELMASMSGYENANNVDLTKDPVLGKALFNDPAFAAAYKASTGLRTDRLDAKDLAPYIPDVATPAAAAPVQAAAPTPQATSMWSGLANMVPAAATSWIQSLANIGKKP